MKRFISFLFLFFSFSNPVILSQTYNFTEYLQPEQNVLAKQLQSQTLLPATTMNEVVIVAIDSCDYQSSLLPAWFTQNYNRVHDFFTDATFGNYNYIVSSIKFLFIWSRNNKSRSRLFKQNR